MILIILGCIISGIMLIVSDRVEKKKTENILYAGAIVIFFLFVFFSICVPTKYGERKSAGLIQIEVSRIYEEIDSKKLILMNSTDETSTFIYKGEVYGYDVNKIIEDSKCEIPGLIRYVQEPKISIWTFAFLGKENEEYILYIPKGAVQQEILN